MNGACRLSAIIEEFNPRWGGDHAWKDGDRVIRAVTVAKAAKFRNAWTNPERGNVRVESDPDVPAGRPGRG